MSASNQPRGPAREWYDQIVEGRARHIGDPVKRLRFLKRAMARGPKRIKRIYWSAVPLLASLVWWPAPNKPPSRPAPPVHAAAAEPGRAAALPSVWLVNREGSFETWSNGLRVETRFETDAPPRSYLVYDLSSASRDALGPASHPAGIIFHSTESLQAPFEEDQNRRLQRLGENLLSYVRSKRCYNYVVDRFGRVWRVVPDGAMANHAGWSVWGSGSRVWVNLNRSFLGVALEAETGDGAGGRVTPAQLHATRILTEMLRARHQIPPENCATHGQVSVSLSGAHLGYHTDWLKGFPFADLGLPNNYARTAPAVFGFGIAYAQGYSAAADSAWAAGLRAAEEALAREAAERGVSAGEWRSRLQRRYQQLRTEPQDSGEEASDEL